MTVQHMIGDVLQFTQGLHIGYAKVAQWQSSYGENNQVFLPISMQLM